MHRRFITGLLTGMVVSTMLFAVSAIAAQRPAKTSPGGRLARVFVPDMLTADLPYLEHITGPAWRSSDDSKVYKVDGCEVTVAVDHGSVHTLGLALGSKCTFDLGKFLGGTFPPLHTMTFGQFEALTGGGRSWFMAPCLSNCGNLADPVVFMHWEGPHTQSFLNVILEVALGGGDSLDAADIWRRAMEANEGVDWVEDGKFNCHGSKYDALAHKAFKHITITAITVGYAIDMKMPRCQ